MINSTILFSQNFYEIKYKANDVNYTSFITFYSKDIINVRTAFNYKGNSKIAEFNCKGKYMRDKYGDKYFVFDGNDAKVVYSKIQDGIAYR